MKHVITAAEDGQPLADVLGRWLPSALGRPVSRSLVRRLVVAGVVRVDGHVARHPGQLVRGGQEVAASVDESRLPPAPAAFAFDASRVLYRDAVVIAVDKPAGIPTVPTADPARPSLSRAVEAWLGGDAHLGVHQRLDRDTSGAVLFTLVREADARMAQQFAARTVEKEYLALVEQPAAHVADAWTVERPMPDGAKAATGLRVVRRFAHGLLVEARPRTGRKHQIRIHLASCGLPILGDEAYGGRRWPGGRLMLHARRLTLRHPTTDAPLVVESPLPPDFTAVLETLAAGRTLPRSAAPSGHPRARGARARPGRRVGRGGRRGPR